MFTALQRKGAVTFRALIHAPHLRAPSLLFHMFYRSLLHVAQMTHKEGSNSGIYLALHFYFTHKQIEVLHRNRLSLLVDGRNRSGTHAQYSSLGFLLLYHQIPTSSPPFFVEHPFCHFHLFCNSSRNDTY